MLKLYLGAVGKMAWKLLLFYLDKLTLSELQIQGPLWPFIMKKAFLLSKFLTISLLPLGAIIYNFKVTILSSTYRKSLIHLSEKWFWICVLGISLFKRNSKPAQKFSKCQSGFSSREKEIFLTGFSYEYKTSSTFIKLKHKRYLMTWTKVLFTIQLLSLMDFFSLPFACKWHEFGISLLFSSHSTLDGSFPCCPRDHPSFQCAKMGGVY